MQTKQRGSGWSIRLVFNLYKLFGYRFIYYLMYPVTFFYFIFASNVKEALRIYYKQIGLEFNNWVYYEHLRMFAITMVDRFITKADPQSYTFVYDDPNRPLEIFEHATILVLSHFGGWAASSNSSRTKNRMNIVMKEALKGSIKEIEDALGYKETIKVIDINKGPIAVSISIANALMADEVVAIMGDRASNPNANIALEFFGKEAFFNKNPFEIAYKMKKPLVIYFVAWIDLQKYNVEFYEIEMDYSKSKDEVIKSAMQDYVAYYEAVLRKHPNQWLNFYDFWAQSIESN
jgi:predicted LPLAT superfamily acyltransferase